MLRPVAGALRIAYGILALAIFCLLFAIAALLVLVVPRLEWRRSLVRSLARTALFVLRVRVAVAGLEQLPPGPCIVVANHSSYLDGLVLNATMPPRFSFVIKREAAQTPLLGVLLRRIGAEFVDRHSSSGRQRDARRVIRRAEQGHSLVFFPEGTFDEVVGLKRFHVGAFAAAIRGQVPVVPAVIHGARRALPSHSVIVNAGRVGVEILQPLPSSGPAVTAESLRDEARRRILARLDEPDLAAAASVASR
jgi:1-acyl-sn-glycerol-3-phosphate acyltransferase